MTIQQPIDTSTITLSAAAQGPYLAATYLNLATIAYSDEKALFGANALKAVSQAIPALPAVTVPGNAGQTGTLTYQWGAAALLDANLVYAVSCNDSNDAPQFLAVVLRGTDTATDGPALFKQICEDLRCDSQLDWDATVTALSANHDLPAAVKQPYANPAIAMGTAKGLQKILSLKDSSHTNVASFVQDFVIKYPGVPVVVTGHSLGGCQTIVLAQYLSQTLTGSPILVSQPWAPPTPGNQAFATLYDTTFGARSFVWWNTLDVVPNAFWNMSDIPTLWTNVAMSEADKLIYAAINGPLTLSKCTYALPATNGTTLTGAQPAAGPKWISELCTQHFPPMYAQLLAQNTSVWSYNGIPKAG